MMKIFLTALFSVMLFAECNRLAYHIDFHDTQDLEDAKEYLQKRGFVFELDEQKFHFFIQNHRLYIETKKRAAVLFGKIFLKDKSLQNPCRAKIVWGVERFPKGANWEEGVNRVPIGLILVFGEEKLPSGIGPLAPKVPHFLCPFIGEKEKVGKRYLGKLYKKGGRYYCVSNELNQSVTTEFDVEKEYKKAFGVLPPELKAFAFQVNTKSTHGGSKAYIESLSIYTK